MNDLMNSSNRPNNIHNTSSRLLIVEVLSSGSSSSS